MNDFNRFSDSFRRSRQIIKTDRGRKHAHFVARAHAPSIFQECRDYHRQKMSWPIWWSKVGWKTKCHQACDWTNNFLSLTSDHLRYVRDLIWASFQSWVLVTETMAFGSTVHSQKESWLCLPALSSACDSEYRSWLKLSYVVFGCVFIMTHFHWVSAMSIKLPRIYSLFSLVNISWCS